MLLAAALSIELFRRGRDFSAGVVLALCAIKAHLLVLTPIPFLLHGRWRVLGGLASGGVLLAAVSVLSDGWDWPVRYLRLLSNPELHPGPEHMPTLRNLTITLTGEESMRWLVPLSGIVLALVMLLARKFGVEAGFGLALVGGVLISYHAYTQDCALFLLTYCVTAAKQEWRPLRWALTVLVIPPLYLLLLAGAPYSSAVPVALLLILGLAIFTPSRLKVVS